MTNDRIPDFNSLPVNSSAAIKVNNTIKNGIIYPHINAVNPFDSWKIIFTCWPTEYFFVKCVISISLSW